MGDLRRVVLDVTFPVTKILWKSLITDAANKATTSWRCKLTTGFSSLLLRKVAM